MVTVADVVEYFAGGRTVMVPHEGYDEPVAIPACPREKVEAAVEQAVERGSLCLLNGPASFQGEAVPAGVLTATATLRAPMAPLPVQRLLPDAIADAWVSGEANVLALAAALAVQEGHPVPWSVLRRAIDDAMTARWLEAVPGSGTWPCEVTAAATVKLRTPTTERVDVAIPAEAYKASAPLEPDALQDLVDALDEIVKASAGVRLARAGTRDH